MGRNSKPKPALQDPPEFVPTAAQKRSVSIVAGAGVSHEEIALGLAIGIGELRKHFAYELTTGAYERRKEVIEAMFAAAEKGNVSAQKAYIALTPHLAAPPLPPEQPTKPEGKKAQRQADAVTAAVGTDWADLLTPGRAQ